MCASSTNDYFKAMGVPLIKGRLFAGTKRSTARTRSSSTRPWPRRLAGEDPIGKRVKISWNDDREDEVIGVVGDVRHLGLETEPRAMTYWPYPRFVYSSMALGSVRRDP